MPYLRLLAILIVIFLGHVLGAHAQGKRSDYERASKLRELTRDKVFRDVVKPQWMKGNRRFWYRNDLADGVREFILVDAKRGNRVLAFDHDKLAKALAKASGQDCDARRLAIDKLEFEGKKRALSFACFDKRWACDLKTYTISEVTPPPASPEQEGKKQPKGRDRNRRHESPDGKWLAVIKDHNVFLRDKATGDEVPLTTDGAAEHRYEGRIAWAPDSGKLVVVRTQHGDDREVHLIEAAPEDQLQPKLHVLHYLKPGDKISQGKPRLFDIQRRAAIPIDDQLFPNPWSIDAVRWDADSARFTFRYNQRGHQLLRVIAVDATTGEAGVLIDERSETFVDYAYKTYEHHLDESNEIIWMSERDGWNHLYLCDSRTGHVKNQITKGKWVVRGVDRVDAEKRKILFRASGVYPEQDPYYIHYCRVDFDGRGFKILTRGNGTHAIEYSPDRKYFLDRYSRVDMPPVTELRRAGNGKLVWELERGDWSQLRATGWRPPERFVAKSRDGETDIYGVIWRPTNFDPEKRYPIVENIYAGPHGAFVPKRFAEHYKSQELAELGFIVVKIDGMGTNWRSKGFHDVCWKNLGDSGFPDRIAWIKAAAKKYPFMDLDRVGIYGGSAGGQSATRAMLAHGDFYKVAVADCGCHDNRMDKIWWNEFWMGWPISEHYEQQSNVTNAHKLTGKLFLIVGALDRNVDPASTMQVVDALIKADKDFDLLVVPQGGHGIAESPYGTRRRRDFFVRHLLGVEPRSEP